MAETIRDTFFENKAAGALWDVAVSIKRGNPLPLDSNSVFASYGDLETYARGVLAYPGQIVAVVNADSTGIYYLDQNLAINEVGKIPTGDDKSIEVNNEKISIHDFGKAFYKYVAEVKDEEGNVTSEAHYEKVNVGDKINEEGEEVYTWKAGLEPKVVSEDNQLVIGWFEPNPTTIEGVNDQVTAVQGTVADLEVSVGAPADGETPATGLYKEIDDVEAEVETVKEDVETIQSILNGTEGGDGVEEVKGLVERVDVAEEALNSKTDKTYVDEELGKKANSADVYTKTDADALLNNKADKANTLAGYGITDAYTKTEVEGLVNSAGHLKRVVLQSGEELPLVSNADANTIYMKPLSGGLIAQDTYEEWMVIDGNWELIGNTRVDLSEYAKTTYVDDEINKVEEELAKKANTETVNAALELKANQSALDEANEAIAKKAEQSDLELTNEEVAKKANKTYVDDEIAKKADTSIVNELGQTVANNKQAVDEALLLKADKTALEALATKQELNDGLAQKIGEDALAPYAKTADVNAELAKKVDKTVYDEKIAAIDNAVGAKLDIATYENEKSSFATDAELANAIGQAPTRTETENGEVNWEGATGIYTNIYTKDEITDLIADITGGESAADVLAALNAYKTSTDPRIKALENTVNGIPANEETGAEAVAGLVERVENLENKEDYVLPVATAEQLGGVKSSDAENGIAIDNEGKMSVNSLNANKLVQTTGEFLILYGGSASDNLPPNT